MVEPLLDNPRSLTAKVAAVLGGKAIQRPQLTGFLNSEFDPFLNQLFAAGPVTPREAAEALEALARGNKRVACKACAPA